LIRRIGPSRPSWQGRASTQDETDLKAAGQQVRAQSALTVVVAIIFRPDCIVARPGAGPLAFDSASGDRIGPAAGSQEARP
jgi:hypothetical protein